MTDHEMRKRLAEAMGWTEIRDPLPPIWPGEDTAGMPPEGHRPCYRDAIPDPLDNDRDAALLRAWLVRQEWCSSLAVTTGSRDVEVTIYGADGEPIDDTPITVTRVGEPDPCRRERLAICRAVIQALEAIKARGEP